MSDIYTVVVGRLATSPDKSRLADGTTRVHFRVASSARRYDKATDTWQDGETSYLGVTCWRRLGDNANTSFVLGDPVVVYGKLRVRSFEGRDGIPRTATEIEAVAVGPDLTHCTAAITRTKRSEPARVDIAPGDTDSGSDDPWSAAREPSGDVTEVAATLPAAPVEAGVGA